MSLKEYINNYLENLKLNKELYYNDIYLLLSYYNNIKVKDIYFILDKEVSNEDIEKYNNILNRYFIDKEPLQYIIGKWYFFNEEYIVNNNVLIPRQDTEILVETAIKYINMYKLNNCLDVCCGSGCVGISISKNSNIKKVDLIDISKKALEVTESNIKYNNAEKCKCYQSDLFLNIEKSNKFDIIVSNPPYIPSKDILKLTEYVKKEPMLALDGGKDGLDIYNRFFNDSIYYLNDNAIIMVEIGFNQKEDILNIINNIDCLKYLECIKDYGNNERVIVCRFLQK